MVNLIIDIFAVLGFVVTALVVVDVVSAIVTHYIDGRRSK